MLKRCLFFIIVLLFAFSASEVSAQRRSEKSSERPICIVDSIQADSVNVVVLPDGLWDLIDYEPATAPRKEQEKKVINPKPFTVQVYSDKSRDEANSRAAKVQARFPQFHVRRYYSSPYFRVYLGAFETAKEAQAVVQQIRRAFPAFANEVHWTKTSVASSTKKR